MQLRRVLGKSMLPAYRPGDIVIMARAKPAVGAVVVARMAGTDVIKRVTAIAKDKLYLQGDNHADSVDSREYGPVHRRDIVGVVKGTLRIPRIAFGPSSKGVGIVVVSTVLAGVYALLLVAQIYRIDEVVPQLARLGLPGGARVGLTVYVLLLASQLFAVPYLLRMGGSLTARAVSGALVAVVPWGWLMIHLWMLGVPASTFQLGSMVPAPATLATVMLHIVWLGGALWVLAARGYGRTIHDLSKALQ